MTQASDHKPLSTRRRSTRGPRNRPVLVTANTSEDNEYGAEDATTATTNAEESSQEEQSSNLAKPPTKSTGMRLPKFFSTVGKGEQTSEDQEDAAAKARLARATRGKVSSPPAKAASEEETETRKPAARSTAPARPASPFKTRYLIGMGLYLIGANFIGIFETNFFQSQHLDNVLAEFPFFGSNMVIRTSTLAYLATLLILLVLLARFDLIPRSFSALSGQRNARTGTSNRSNNTEGGRSAPPTMRQGVKGADDDLYQQYRANQRRDRKK
jgi:hypothetical protein